MLVLSLLNHIGMKESSEFNAVSTIIEVSGLVVIALIGLFFASGREFTLPESGMTGVFAGTALIFFAYIGFESMANFSEETKKPSSTVPKAMIAALAISTVLYILVSIAAVNVVGPEKLAASKAPLTEVVSATIPQASFVFSLIALFATANTVLIIMIVGSRMIYGLSRQKSIPKGFSRAGKRGTPYIAIATVMLVTLVLLLVGGIKFLALLTDVGIFIVYACVNASLIWLRYRKPGVKRVFRSPLSVGKFPLLAGAGLLSSVFMIFHFDAVLVLYEILIIAAGLLVYKAYKTTRL